MAKCVEELERVASAVTRSLIVCHEARRLARAGVSKVDSANENRCSSSSGSFLVDDVVQDPSIADCYRMSVSQLDVVGAGGASGALIDAEKEAAKQVLLLVSAFFVVVIVSVPCVCLCERCLLAYDVEPYATLAELVEACMYKHTLHGNICYTRAMPIGVWM
jgi:hypothetical protein